MRAAGSEVLSCGRTLNMASIISVRNVPEKIRRQLKARAASAGMSLSEYLLAEIKRSLDRPTRQELLKRLASRTAVQPHRRAD